jgi:hypothetical protein
MVFHVLRVTQLLSSRRRHGASGRGTRPGVPPTHSFTHPPRPGTLMLDPEIGESGRANHGRREPRPGQPCRTGRVVETTV